jgi:hypothetical protein
VIKFCTVSATFFEGQKQINWCDYAYILICFFVFLFFSFLKKKVNADNKHREKDKVRIFLVVGTGSEWVTGCSKVAGNPLFNLSTWFH